MSIITLERIATTEVPSFDAPALSYQEELSTVFFSNPDVTKF